MLKNQSTIHHRTLREALRIRKVEEKFLELFSLGNLNGTVHTCVGQEFSALAFAFYGAVAIWLLIRTWQGLRQLTIDDGTYP